MARSGGGRPAGQSRGRPDREGRIVDAWLRKHSLLSGDEQVEGRVLGRLTYLEYDGIQRVTQPMRTRRVRLSTSRFTELGWLVRTPGRVAMIGPDDARSTWCDLPQLWRADVQGDGSLALIFSSPLLSYVHWAPATDHERAALAEFVPGLHRRADLLRSELDLEARARLTAWQGALAARGDLDWTPGVDQPAPTVEHVEDGLDEGVWIFVLQALHACRRQDGPALRALTKAWAEQNRFELGIAVHYVLLLLTHRVFTDLRLDRDKASEAELVRLARPLFIEVTGAGETELRATLGMFLRSQGQLPYDLLALAPIALLAALVGEPVAELGPLRAWLADQARADEELRALTRQVAEARARARR